MIDCYPLGEVVTADRIENEPWYPDYQKCIEIASGFEFPGHFLPRFVAVERGVLHAKAYFKKSPGPVEQGWTPPAEERLKRWFGTIHDNAVENLAYAKQNCDVNTLRSLRPVSYGQLTKSLQKFIDAELGII